MSTDTTKWKPIRGKKMKWEIIASSLGETMFDIKQVLVNLGHPELTFGRYKVHIEHILHHILVAWDARYATNAQYEQMSNEDFSSWSRMHSDLVPLGARPDGKPPTKPRAGKFDRTWAKRYLDWHWTESERQFTWDMRRRNK